MPWLLPEVQGLWIKTYVPPLSPKTPHPLQVEGLYLLVGQPIFEPRSVFVETVEVHDFGPGIDEVLCELFLGVAGGVDFGYGS